MVSWNKINTALRDIPGDTNALENVLVDLRDEIDALEERVKKLEADSS
jgi:polyhydroxyalkanoate synthesis regulator phasin